MNRTVKIIMVLVCVLSLFGCDMEHILRSADGGGDSGGGVIIDENERDELERTGRFLKLINMPRNTQIPNISATSVANAVSSIGKIDTKKQVKIFPEETTSTVYIPLIYSNGNEFIENGFFYTVFTINVDALTRIIVTRPDNVLVGFTDGRGELDILTLPKNSLPDIWSGDDEPDGGNNVVITPDEREELERTGRFLKLINMPCNTQIPNISATSVANSASTIARMDSKTTVKIFMEETTSTVYIPLVYSNGTEFIETGAFHVMTVIHIDSLTRIIVTKPDNVLVNFTDGRGEIDVLSLSRDALPDIWPGDGNGNGNGNGGDDNVVITPNEREELERTGRFLKLINMPLNTQTPNIVTVSVANTASTIARKDSKNTVKIFREETTSTVYIPLVYSNGTDFTETGAFHVMTVIHIDSLTRIIITKPDNVLVSFTDGRGELNILTLPRNTLPDTWPGDDNNNGNGDEITPEEKEELERTGRFLKLTNLPPNTQSSNVVTASIANSASTIARMDSRTPVKVFKEATTSTVYIPLVYSNGTEFIETGIFYVVFTIRVDALTQFSVARSDNILVSFSDGRGELNILTLPNLPDTWPGDGGDPGGGGTVIIPPDDEEELKRTERYLLLYHLPQSARGEFLFSLNISDGSRSVARIDASRNYSVAIDSSFANMYVPLLAANGAEFTRTGSFYVAFEIRIDALTRIVIRSDHRVLVDFTEGRGTLDVEDIVNHINDMVVPGNGGGDPGDVDEVEREIEGIITTGGYIRFFNLPRNISKTKISAVSVSNGASVIARCVDYAAIAVRRSTLTSEAFVPLTSTRFSAPFTETGAYYTSFSIVVDALTQIVTEPNNPPMLQFDNGVLNYDVTQLPPPPVVPPSEPHALTITNLPDSANITNLADVFIWNQNGKVAKCADYTGITISPLNDKKAALIPLVYDNNPQFNGRNFADSGSFLVTFSFFPDISTSIVVTTANNCVAAFTNGSAVVNIEAIPSIPHNYLTITNLPPQLPLSGVSNVFVWNQSGKIAQCEDYNLLSISTTLTAATVRVPLCYTNSKSIFTNTGSYFVSFDINADALNRITITEKDVVAVNFTSGNGTLDAANLPIIEVPTPAYLTITNLPPNIPRSGVSNVFVRNQAGRVARCDDYNALVIAGTQTSSTVRVPLSYISSGAIFADSGDLFVTFDINIDALNRITITERDAVTVRFTTGNGTLDAHTLPAPEPPTYLTITNLPPQLPLSGISSVLVWNQAGEVAYCSSYDSIVLTSNASSSTVKVPLSYKNSSVIFTDTGDYYISFEINADALNRIIITEKDAVTVRFTAGNASFDANDRPVVPSLTLTELPPNTLNTHFLDVSVYGPSGKIAQYSSIADINVTHDGSLAIAIIPLVSTRTSNNFFRETGAYNVTLSIVIDLNTSITIGEEYPLRLSFTDGSATHNMSQSLGYLSGALTNPSDTDMPVIKGDTTFEINGTFYTISEDTPVTPAGAFPVSTLVYVYAVQLYEGVDFEYSTTAPEFSSAKNGYYSGAKRALWKMFLYKGETEQFFAKTLISDRFSHLAYYTMDSSLRPDTDPLIFMDGTGNPASTTITLQEGIYLFVLKGGGGGAGQNGTRQGGQGGQGGAVSELVFVDRPAEFLFYTAAGGGGGAASYEIENGPYIYTPAHTSGIAIYITTHTAPGGGGGGGGSFIFADDYFLCAGGGAGGSAGIYRAFYSPSSSYHTSYGGAGGAGGSLGPGGNGAAGRTTTDSYTPISNQDRVSVTTTGSAGGSRGGADLSPLPSGIRLTHYGFNVGTAGSAAYCELDPPFDWKNTNGANGQGSDRPLTDTNGEDGGPGGNNRNSNRGGGPSGGRPGNTTASSGGAGSVTIYKLY